MSSVGNANWSDWWGLVDRLRDAVKRMLFKSLDGKTSVHSGAVGLFVGRIGFFPVVAIDVEKWHSPSGSQGTNGVSALGGCLDPVGGITEL